ncbi:E3 ubiquitin-protein ligase rififylin isoform X2 [Denticeps clupeoides]|uniref:RING-type E3 ubiquitin transferase n=1 Tax=Denticeps clupeoides TaxID=299321 RepID=A0AAY4C996_9TELE|nr:E3 ubiquitin-protein ligase rififylin isoform X2 [Denticeps clupeoides]
MWASCCNWICLDSGTVEQSESSSTTRHQAYTNSGYSNHPSPTAPDHTCKACGGGFDTQTRKHICMDCKKSFCSRCSAQVDLRPRLCHTCQRFYGTLFERAELMKLKVKDLRDYLRLHEVSTQMCREKEDLVELVLGHHTPTSNPHTPQQDDQPVTMPPPTSSAPSMPTPTSESLPAHTQILDEGQSSDTEEMLAPGRRASLSDLNSVKDIDALSVRQLKEILARNFVNYKGCCEKWELMERVTRLYHDQQDRQNLVSNAMDNTDPSVTSGMEENLCKICMDSPIDCVLLECGHMVTCTKCGKRMNECPICRQYVVRAVHVFRS